jgi:hypothetical protein
MADKEHEHEGTNGAKRTKRSNNDSENLADPQIIGEQQEDAEAEINRDALKLDKYLRNKSKHTYHNDHRVDIHMNKIYILEFYKQRVKVLRAEQLFKKRQADKAIKKQRYNIQTAKRLKRSKGS